MVLKEILDPEGPILEKWNLIFVLSCLFAVLLDPLFLYTPLINQDMKCIGLDKKLKIAAVVFRSITDFVYIVKIIFHVYKLEKVTVMALWQSSILVDVLAVLPIPQVVILNFFRGSRSLEAMKFMNFLVLVQYVPRVLRIYLACKEFKNSPKGKFGLWIKGGLNFFMYTLASHIFGAFWYFFSIQRMLTCWRYACRSEDGCKPSTFDCHDHRSNRYIRLLNDKCPTNPSDSTLFDFGIFLDALQSSIVGSKNYSQKLSKCFWWGLRNLSSLGSNLQPSINTWETLFATFTSITGLLLFLYLIGNLQMYMQVESASKEQLRWKTELENMMRTERKMRIERSKGLEVEQWLAKNGLPMRLMPEIMEKVVQVDLEQNRDVDVENILSILPLQLQRDILVYKEKLEEEGRKIELWLSENRLPMRLKSEIMEKVVQQKRDENRDVHVDNFLSILPEERRSYIESYKRKLQEKDLEVGSWLSKNGIPVDTKSQIMEKVQVELEENRDVEVKNILSILPSDLQRRLEWYMPLSRLKRVTLLERMDERVLKAICENLQPIEFPAKLVIMQEDQPIEDLFFIVVGSVRRHSRNRPMFQEYETELCGEELLVWPLTTSFPAVLPRATKTVMVGEGFSALLLTASDIKSVGSKFRPQWDLITSYWLTMLKKVPKLQYMDEEVLKEFLPHLNKQDQFAARSSYGIQENVPLKSMYFITEGSLKFTKSDNGDEEFFRSAGEFYGEELLDWVLDTSFPAITPISTHSALCSDHNEATVLAITAEDLKSVASKFSSHFSTLQTDSQFDLSTFVNLTRLKKVPKLQTMDEEVLKAISEHLITKVFNYLKIIEEGKPLHMMLFIVKGNAYLEKKHSTDTVMLKPGQFYGEELLDWPSWTSFPTMPLSMFTVKVHHGEAVEFLVLMANDLEKVVSKFRSHFS
ncbi:cyclic nucleotide-gated ion channel 1 isoform X3 [Rosa chinensis]|nr:cyclic nucleotide-gated ion channel 1 isoform X3 [Rosa chinensis]